MSDVRKLCWRVVFGTSKFVASIFLHGSSVGEALLFVEIRMFIREEVARTIGAKSAAEAVKVFGGKFSKL